MLVGSGTCTISAISTEVMVTSAPGRPLWFALGDGILDGAQGDKALYASFALLQAVGDNRNRKHLESAAAWFQSISGQALQSFSDEAVFFSS